MNYTPLSVETFVGGGGFLTGAKSAGFETRLAIDIWGPAIETINLNYPNIDTICDDIANVSGDEILKRCNLKVGELHHFHGSWPCQQNSSSNTKVAANPTAGVTKEFHLFLDKVEALQPMIVTGENVEGAIRGKKKKFFNEGIERIKSWRNYELVFAVVLCCLLGAPQWRPRLFLLLKRKDIAPGVEITFPEMDYVGREELRFTKAFPKLEGFKDLQFKGRPKSKYNFLSTVMATENIRFIENGLLRRATIAEAKYAMTFPDSYLLPDRGRSVQWKLLGNAVPPETARRIMLHLKQTILDKHFNNYNQ